MVTLICIVLEQNLLRNKVNRIKISALIIMLTVYVIILSALTVVYPQSSIVAAIDLSAGLCILIQLYRDCIR